jgi:hypothetical protein
MLLYKRQSTVYCSVYVTVQDSSPLCTVVSMLLYKRQSTVYCSVYVTVQDSSPLCTAVPMLLWYTKRWHWDWLSFTCNQHTARGVAVQRRTRRQTTVPRLWQRSQRQRTPDGFCPNWYARRNPPVGAKCGRGWRASGFPRQLTGDTGRHSGRTAPQRRKLTLREKTTPCPGKFNF